MNTQLSRVWIGLILIASGMTSFSGEARGAFAPFSSLPACDSTFQKGTQCKAEILTLHPTQMSVGMKEVLQKEHMIQGLSRDAVRLSAYQKKNPIPIVVGPGGRLFLIDHHHLTLAYLKSGLSSAVCQVVAEYTDLSEAGFWSEMQKQSWVYPYDERGRGPLALSLLPQTVEGLRDDPYRSLAGAVRDQGGYRKTSVPFSEFRWAAFFRSRVVIAPSLDGNPDDGFDRAIREALRLSHSPEASGLPGWISEDARASNLSV